MELHWSYPFPVMRLAGGAWHKVSGLVTNRDLPGDEYDPVVQAEMRYEQVRVLRVLSRRG